MHCLLANGVVNITIQLLTQSAVGIGLTNVEDALRQYVSEFRWPSQFQTKGMYEVLPSARCAKHRKSGHVACQASEMLSLTPVVASFCIAILISVAGMRE